MPRFRVWGSAVAILQKLWPSVWICTAEVLSRVFEGFQTTFQALTGVVMSDASRLYGFGPGVLHVGFSGVANAPSVVADFQPFLCNGLVV